MNQTANGMFCAFSASSLCKVGRCSIALKLSSLEKCSGHVKVLTFREFGNYSVATSGLTTESHLGLNVHSQWLEQSIFSLEYRKGCTSFSQKPSQAATVRIANSTSSAKAAAFSYGPWTSFLGNVSEGVMFAFREGQLCQLWFQHFSYFPSGTSWNFMEQHGT